MSRIKNDNTHYWVGVKAEKEIARRFATGGVAPFPEVDLGKAAFLSGIPKSRILNALRWKKLNSRKVGDKHLIRVVDLWYFAVLLETKKLQSKDR